MAVDYDAPRSAPANDDSGLDVFTVRRGTARSDTGDMDDTTTTTGTESPAIDTVDGELTGPVVAMRGDEFRCEWCFLINHRHRLVLRGGAQICRECA